MKRQLTAEQIAARDARRAQFKALLKQVAAMTDAQRAEIVNRAGAVVTCEGRALSIINTMLLLLQSGGTVSIVGGFRQWLSKGRCVRKGQHGLTIWIPLGNKASEANTEATEADSMRFGTATVFDITQTEETAAQVTA
jgi:hypothetical protein